jgi:hypothetical protein
MESGPSNIDSSDPYTNETQGLDLWMSIPVLAVTKTRPNPCISRSRLMISLRHTDFPVPNKDEPDGEPSRADKTNRLTQ